MFDAGGHEGVFGHLLKFGVFLGKFGIIAMDFDPKGGPEVALDRVGLFKIFDRLVGVGFGFEMLGEDVEVFDRDHLFAGFKNPEVFIMASASSLSLSRLQLSIRIFARFLSS